MKVMVNGLPGKMATEVANSISADPAIKCSNGFELVKYSLTGPEITQKFFMAGLAVEQPILLINTDKNEAIEKIKELEGDFLSVDFTQPDSVNANADFYCRHNLPFVMGTTGGDRKALEERVRNSDIMAVIAPNMAKQIVALQELVKNYSEQNPNSLKGYKLKMIESHQNGKKDTSGTAKAMVQYFNKLGIPFEAGQIKMIREPAEQHLLGVPEEHLAGHGWHTYALSPGAEAPTAQIKDFADEIFNFLSRSPVFKEYIFDSVSSAVNVACMTSKDNTVLFRTKHWTEEGILQLTHNVNGRAVYASGTLDALKFLEEKVSAGKKGKVYSMIDVLNAGIRNL